MNRIKSKQKKWKWRKHKSWRKRASSTLNLCDKIVYDNLLSTITFKQIVDNDLSTDEVQWAYGVWKITALIKFKPNVIIKRKKSVCFIFTFWKGEVPLYVEMYRDNTCTKMSANFQIYLNIHQIDKNSTATKMIVPKTRDKIFWQGVYDLIFIFHCLNYIHFWQY